eukprot:PITA_07220
MKIVSWNTRGLNSLAKQRLLQRKFQKEKSDIMFIQETKCATTHMGNINKKLGKPIDFIEVASQRWEGGITTLWDTRVVRVLSMEATRSYIATKIQVIESIILEGITVDSDILPSGGSDHWPISLEAAFLGTPRNKPFRFEKFWLQHPNFVKKLEKWWREPLNIKGTRMFKLQSKLKHIKSKIKQWNATKFGNIFQEKSIIESKLEHIHKTWTSGNISEVSKVQKKDLMAQWLLCCKHEETLWRQKSRVQWLKEGEQNTKFFHRSTLDYRSANKILKLKNEAGETLQNHKDISSLLTRHFKHIAQETQDERTKAIESLAQAIPSIITTKQNLALLREVSMEEVEEVVKSMPNNKALGPDGFTINFYKACWPTIKTKVWEVVEDSRRSCTILKSLNSTFLALVPEEEDANTPEKFRPVALCNVIYKIISKVIANRLKSILPNLISEEQSGYVEGRQILDNILLAQEMVHTLQTRKIAGMLMQMDLSKAFDKVN